MRGNGREGHREANCCSELQAEVSSQVPALQNQARPLRLRAPEGVPGALGALLNVGGTHFEG